MVEVNKHFNQEYWWSHETPYTTCQTTIVTWNGEKERYLVYVQKMQQ